MRFRDLKLLDRRSLSGLLVGCIDDADKLRRRPGDLNGLHGNGDCLRTRLRFAMQ